jgi:nitrilase
VYAECEASAIKAAKVLFDSLGRYTRWDVVQLLVREHGWAPERAMHEERSTAAFRLPTEELRRISGQCEIPIEKLEAALNQIALNRAQDG